MRADVPPDLAPPDPDNRRHAAGADPRKRDQILDGARRVFTEAGFDGASIDDVRRAAGVSKGTIYVYFPDKEELFTALFERERARLFAGLDAILDAGASPAEALGRFGEGLAAKLFSEEVVRAQRTIIGIAARMPALALRFQEGAARRTQDTLGRFLARETAAGRMAVPDPALAAAQFVELATAGLWRPRLFGGPPPAPDLVAARVGAAVAVFMAAYGPASSPASSPPPA